MPFSSIHLRRLIISAIFLSLALIIRFYFTHYIPLFGVPGMRVGFHEMFVVMPAILFGPLLGGITAGLADVLGFALRPSGTFIPLMTVSAVLGGVIRGAVWLLLRRRNPVYMRRVVIAMAIVFLFAGLLNIFMLNADGITADFYTYNYSGEIDTSSKAFISRWLIERTQFEEDRARILSGLITSVTLGAIGAGAFALLLLLLIDFALSVQLKKFNMEYGSAMPLLLTMLASGWIVNSINTVLLMHFLFPQWQELPFITIWFPRIIQNTIVTTVSTYFVAILLGVCNREKILKKLII